MTDYQPLFIDGQDGRLFLVHYPPAAAPTGNCVLVLPAFAEEMNKCRRQVALQSRALAARGSAVLVADLRGTGDSDGELHEASLDGWIDDLGRVVEFAYATGYSSISILAVRAGALLLAPLLNGAQHKVTCAVLWQPPASGRLYINQFLRLKVAAGLMGNATGISVKDLRTQIDDGEAVEVAGYLLGPGLVSSLDGLELSQIGPHSVPDIHWIARGQPDGPPPPIAQRILDGFEGLGIGASYQACDGDPFWATAEIATSPTFIRATCAALS